jgi:hypothetical protein
MTQELISLLVGNLDKLSLAISLLNLQKTNTKFHHFTLENIWGKVKLRLYVVQKP